MEQTKSTQKTCCKCTTVGSGVRTNLPWKPRKTIKYLCWVMTIKIRIFGWTMTIKYGFWPPATKPSRIASLSNPLLKSCLWAWSHWQTLTKKDLLSVTWARIKLITLAVIGTYCSGWLKSNAIRPWLNILTQHLTNIIWMVFFWFFFSGIRVVLLFSFLYCAFLFNLTLF